MTSRVEKIERGTARRFDSGIALEEKTMRIYLTKDYRNRQSGKFGMSTGLYYSFCEPDGGYISLQVRRLGSIALYWCAQ